MSRKSQVQLAEVLIAFSLILIIIGIGLGLEKKTIVNPVTNTHVVGTANSSDINITTTEDPVTEQTPEQQEPTQQPTTPAVENKEQAQPKAATTSLEQTNKDLRDSIQRNYGVTIRYGAETNGYRISGLSTSMLTDATKINDVLSTLNYNLSLYPPGFFDETKKGGYTLTLYLIKCYSQKNVTGITDSSTSNIVISLATDYSFIESLHHEIYHYIEKYMYDRGANYTTWNNLNPQEFVYGLANSSLSYTTGNNPNASFVNNYAQTDEYEDRASTFEYMMSQTEASCLQTGTPIWKKAKYICEQIDAVFRTVTPSNTEYWERYVYN